jgi:hypothetical protein
LARPVVPSSPVRVTILDSRGDIAMIPSQGP